jgi:hypothetical protein
VRGRRGDLFWALALCVAAVGAVSCAKRPPRKEPTAPPRPSVRYDYSGSWSTFAEAAIPEDVRADIGAPFQGILVKKLPEVLKDDGELPKDAEYVELGQVPGSRGFEPVQIEVADGALGRFIMPVSHPGRRLWPKEVLPPDTAGLVEFRENKGKVTALVYDQEFAPPTTEYGVVALYVRAKPGGNWVYANPLGATLARLITSGQFDIPYPKLFTSPTMPEDILGKLERRVPPEHRGT